LFSFLRLTEAQSKEKTLHGLNLVLTIDESLRLRLWIPLGQFFAIHSFDERQMSKFGYGSSKDSVEIDMLVGIGEPLFTSHDVGDLHLPVVDNISEVKGGPAVTSDDHEIV
jgi:hypothetical protein